MMIMLSMRDPKPMFDDSIGATLTGRRWRENR